MSTFAISRASPTMSGAGIMSALAAMGTSAYARFLRRMQIRRDRRVLHALPDHMLRDMGIYRCEIERVTEYGRRALPDGKFM